MSEVSRAEIRETFGALVALEESQVASGAAAVGHGVARPLSVAATVQGDRVLSATLRPVYGGDDALKAASQLGVLLRAHQAPAFSATWETSDIEAMTGHTPAVAIRKLATWLVTESSTAVSLWDYSGEYRGSQLDPTDMPRAAVALMMGWGKPTSADEELMGNPEVVAAGMRRTGFDVVLGEAQ